jgi:hypothetical protein
VSGAFIWYELLADDVAAAAAFYARVVGWRALDGGLPGPGYRYLSIAGEDVGGLVALPAQARAAGARPCWLPYLQAPDLESCVAAIARDGGTVQMPPMTVPGVGRLAMLADPQGASFYAMAPEGAGESRSFDRELGGHCGWNELHVPDARAALDFHGRHFGWRELGPVDAGDPAAGLRFGLGSAGAPASEPLGAIVGSAVGVHPHWLCAFNVDDIDAAARRLRSAGGEALPGLRQVADGQWLLPARDPQGARFALLGRSWGA